MPSAKVITAIELHPSDRAEYEALEAALLALIAKRLDPCWSFAHKKGQPITYGDIALIVPRET